MLARVCKASSGSGWQASVARCSRGESARPVRAGVPGCRKLPSSQRISSRSSCKVRIKQHLRTSLFLYPRVQPGCAALQQRCLTPPHCCQAQPLSSFSHTVCSDTQLHSLPACRPGLSHTSQPACAAQTHSDSVVTWHGCAPPWR